MSYDQWKTNDIFSGIPAEDIEPTELDLVYADLHATQREARKYRGALFNLYVVVKALMEGSGLSTPMLREYLKQHPASIAAADALGTDEGPKW